MKAKLTVKDWDDAADLFEQGAVQAEASYETHTSAACKHAIKRMNSLAMFATKRARALEISRRRVQNDKR